MKDRFRRANLPTTARAADHLGACHQQVAYAVVSAGAFAASAGGHLEKNCVGICDRR
jgi:hypothetical protein